MIRSTTNPTLTSLINGTWSIATSYLDLIYPPTCTFCGGAIPQRRSIQMCRACIDAIKGSCSHWCRKCGMPMELARHDERTCNRCVKTKFPFQQVSILGQYEGAMREAVIAGKKHFHEPLTMALGHLLGQQIATQIDEIPDVVTYVPSHWRRKLGRGTTPAATLATEVGRVLRRPVRKSIRCIRATTKQSTLPADKRASNISGAFAVSKRFRCEGCSFLIIDDVMTTGSTLSEVSRMLFEAGATKVSVAATARGAGKT